MSKGDRSRMLARGVALAKLNWGLKSDGSRCDNKPRRVTVSFDLPNNAAGAAVKAREIERLWLNWPQG